MHYHYLTIEQRETLERLIRSQGSGDVSETLRRLHSPDYGVCQRCGADIPYVRLMADPATLYCTACLRPTTPRPASTSADTTSTTSTQSGK